jgi:thiamine biosynthesis protein ThiS
MEILINNRKELFNVKQMNIRELIEFKKFTFKLIIFKVNGKIIPREEFESTFINDGDNVQAIHMISGG